MTGLPLTTLTTWPAMASNCSHCALGDLLDSTPYTLAYALPLLLISFVITFAGTFLTLDRTTIFAPRTNIVKSLPRNASGMKRIESSLLWLSMFEGGVGGIAAGYAFAGTHPGGTPINHF